MVFQCCVYGCKSSSDICNPVGMFRFPKVKKNAGTEKNKIFKKRQELWFNAVKRKGLNINKLDGYRVCSKHFISGQPSKDPAHPDWVPNLHMGYPSPCSKVVNVKSPRTRGKQKLERFQRVRNRARRKIDFQVENEIQMVECQEHEQISIQKSPNASEIIHSEPESGSSSQTDIDLSAFALLEQKLAHLEEENKMLKTQLAVAYLKEEAFQNTEDKMSKKLKFYTGLPNLETVKLILSYIDDALSKIKVPRLNNFQKLILALMKLRLNSTFTALSYRFSIAVKHVSYVFQQVVLLLDYTFDHVVHWPDPKIVSANMPDSFRKLYEDKVKLIIDCFEVKTQKPSLLKSQLQAYSTYKGGHTIKYLIGITPQGFICYISDGWGGRTSDRVITEKCGILNNVLPEDKILADRGFTVHELVASKEAKLLTPAFTKNKPQLHPNDVEETRKLASLRIHVERVIGTIRNKFKITNGPIPISILDICCNDRNFIDSIVKCCCILTNMCPSVVPSSESVT